MAPAASVDPRLGFLKKAAHLIAVQSPTVAATLGAERDKLFSSQDADLNTSSKKDYEALRREVCGACGNLMVPGWSCKSSRAERPGKMQPSRKATLKNQGRQDKSTVYTCLRCDRKTSIPMQPTKRKKIAKATASNLSKEEDKSSIAKPTIASKQRERAKARKGGLQALLAKSKTQTSSRPGLDFMDFMQ
ncbi:hypothetical protein BDV96DRAFT_641590 [Lophiotrema nucula]|uniref:RNAse P Rpr2/Rpp21/SNM1 subunit domain-containing protein n=1 Tax=Lophiotrema nucula TaxID=690887 RepID=A0A6A5ZP32_9PLEO|nr:hypothetical protein BDV96DRAFT_641590 [Lophiotrema nucula]